MEWKKTKHGYPLIHFRRIIHSANVCLQTFASQWLLIALKRSIISSRQSLGLISKTRKPKMYAAENGGKYRFYNRYSSAYRCKAYFPVSCVNNISQKRYQRLSVHSFWHLKAGAEGWRYVVDWYVYAEELQTYSFSTKIDRKVFCFLYLGGKFCCVHFRFTGLKCAPTIYKGLKA